MEELKNNIKEKEVLTIEARSLPDRRFCPADFAEKLPESYVELLSNGVLRIPLAQKEKFHHSAYGTVEFTDSDFAETINNFQEDILGWKPYITYGHLKDTNAVDDERKKGNLEDLKVEDDVLYGYFSSPPEVYDLVKAGEYEYSSGEFVRNFKDKKTGENKGTVLLRTALTNSPFIPFKDKKVQALSQDIDSSDDCLQNITHLVVKVSSDSNNQYKYTPMNTNNSPESLSNTSTQENLSTVPTVVPTVSNQPISNIEENVQLSEIYKQGKLMEQLLNSISSNISTPKENPLNTTTTTPVLTETTTHLEATEPKKIDESNIPVTNGVNATIDVASIVRQITSELASSYEKQFNILKEQTSSTIKSLKEEILSLTEKLVKQEQVSQAFSNSLTMSQKKARYAQLQEQGLTPVLIQKFSQLEEALESGSQIIKLSISEGQVEEKSVTELIAAALVEAVNTEPVQVEQFGQSFTKPSGLVADMERLIQVNKEKVSKVSIS